MVPSEVEVAPTIVSPVINCCVEVMNKKQEFGGANLHIGKLNCSGLIFVDDHSKLLMDQ